ncbi:MAG: hypothetical protein PHH06_04180 [Candidatus Gracilibacteria bacterium]|nr:hypothetical protein [Candidatus Gracilibacteria bacterium]
MFIIFLGDQFFLDLKLGIIAGNSILSELLFNHKIVYLFFIFMIIGFVTLILYIPFKLGLIRTIVQIYNNREIIIIDNIIWGFNRVIESFKTYWYMFKYAYLLPSLFFIIFGILFILLGNNESIAWIFWFLLFLFSVFTFLYVAYKGLKIVFAIISAVSEDDFTNQNFINSIKVTDGKWWRILGNVILASFILYIVFSLITGLFNSVLYLFNFNTGSNLASDILQIESGDLGIINNYINSLDLKELVNPNIHGFFMSIFNSITKSITEVFMTVFMFIFFKRLQYESEKPNLNK